MTMRTHQQTRQSTLYWKLELLMIPRQQQKEENMLEECRLLILPAAAATLNHRHSFRIVYFFLY